VIEKYTHHGAEVFVDSELKGQHRAHCLCYRCANFHPGKTENCAIAQKLYQICVDFDLVTPVYECPAYRVR
jgi:hypothetical protein